MLKFSLAALLILLNLLFSEWLKRSKLLVTDDSASSVVGANCALQNASATLLCTEESPLPPGNLRTVDAIRPQVFAASATWSLANVRINVFAFVGLRIEDDGAAVVTFTAQSRNFNVTHVEFRGSTNSAVVLVASVDAEGAIGQQQQQQRMDDLLAQLSEGRQREQWLRDAMIRQQHQHHQQMGDLLVQLAEGRQREHSLRDAMIRQQHQQQQMDDLLAQLSERRQRDQWLRDTMTRQQHQMGDLLAQLAEGRQREKWLRDTMTQYQQLHNNNQLSTQLEERVAAVERHIWAPLHAALQHHDSSTTSSAVSSARTHVVQLSEPAVNDSGALHVSGVRIITEDEFYRELSLGIPDASEQ